MDNPLIIIGAGGHAKVLIDTLLLLPVKILGATDAASGKHGGNVLGVPILGNDQEILRHSPDTVSLVNGIGSVRAPILRGDIYARFKGMGYHFAGVVHPSAFISRTAELSAGVQVMAGAIVQTGCLVGSNTIINTGALVDHDCQIGEHVHIAPGTTLSGEVTIGEGSHIGTGATIIQGIRIGAGCLVAAGAVVIEDVPDGRTVAGVPARTLNK
ncbi:MAG: acetyltransferase [Betaproteobacteria bacterium]|nr:acetyltransferase [Betaproteobacteria bacterium]